MEILDQESDVQKFYNGKNIFLTGGTGFIGKILVEKLLRSCQVSTIYFLIREKKNKDIQTRIKDLFDDLLYDQLRQKNPNFHHKIHPIIGDCTLPGLGISTHDREILCKSINVVFHVAASVRFDEKLSIAMGINVRGTREVLQLCHGMEHLEALVHVSTAYSNSNRSDIDEKFYKCPISATVTLKTYEELEDETLPRIECKRWPNTYTYSKALAEDLIRTESKGLPVAIVRPAVVLPMAQEPFTIDKLYGATGLVIGVAKGVLHILYDFGNVHAELIPADMCVNAILVCAKDRATREHQETPIVNLLTTPENKISWREYMSCVCKNLQEVPTMRSIWYMNTKITHSVGVFNLLWFLYHTLPAFFVDIGLRLVGKRPKMMDMYRKFKKLINIAAITQRRKFFFTCTNMVALWESLSPRDQELFYFDMGKIEWNTYIRESFLCTRQYFLKDPLSTIPAARKKQQRFKIIHYFLIYTLYALMGLFLMTLLRKLL